VSTAVYVYGVVAADAEADAAGAEGVSGAPVATVASGRLAALVSRLPQEGLRMRRRDLQAHLAVLERAFERTTVVPCRFGVMLPDEDAVRRELLDARRDELARALERLEGCTQLNVRVDFDEEEVLREIVVADREIAALRHRTQELGDAGHFARIRLGELVAAAVAARRESDAERVLVALRAAADDVVVDQAGDLRVLKASFLVRDAARFEAVLEELARVEAPQLRFESIGPLPPTAFAPDSPGSG
jgi:hypothetical protein